MAARKSCTKLTWAEAKNRVGESSSLKGSTKNKGLVGTKNHATHQAQKIISKNDGRSDTDRIKDRQAARLARKDAERQEQLARAREEAKEQAKLDQLVSTFDLAVERISKLADEHCEKGQVFNSLVDVKDLDLDQVCECRQMQLDEILALEAIYDGTEMEPLSFITRCRLEDHRTTVEEWQMDEENETIKKAIRDLPPLSFTLKLVLDDEDGTEGTSSDSELVALMLLQVTFPPLYPLYEGRTPQFDVLDCVVVDKTMVCNRNKVLESLGYLRQEEFIEALNRQSHELQGMPSVYEVVATWLPEEGLFSSFIKMNELI
jgi:RWD domain